MSSDTSAHLLRSTIERLVTETDPRLRDRLLVAGARAAVGAAAAALWRESSPGAFWCVCASGPEPDLPSGAQVAGVAQGRLPGLPSGCGLVIAGTGAQRCALALGGLLPGAREDAEELLEPLLLLHDSLGREDTPVLDRVLPPFAAQGVEPCGAAWRGVHRPQRGPADGELRALLSGIRESQERLAREALGAEERAREGELLEQRCQRAGDLLLGPQTEAPPREHPPRGTDGPDART